jgi:DNA-binding beta-propeller fold protein YncE
VTTVSQPGPLSDLALSRDGASPYVLNADESAITSVDVSSQKVTGVTLRGAGINSLAIPPDGQTVWASSYAFASGGYILMLNPATGRLNFTVGPTGALTFAPNGTVLDVANPAEVIALDVTSIDRMAAFHAGQLENIAQAIPSPDGKYLYISLTFVSGSPTTPQERVVLPPGDIVVLDASSLKAVTVTNIPDGLGRLH